MEHLIQMRKYYDSGITRPLAFRKRQLLNLKAAVKKHADDLQQALYSDLKKSPEEAWVTETGFLLTEIDYTLKNLRSWMEPLRVPTNLLNFPSKSFVLQEPKGVVLIIGPWNYPLNLLFTPLAGAIAAGNCVVLKASEFAAATASVMKKIISETFDPAYVQITDEDGATVIPAMMNNFTFDHVFYTGSTAVGKIIYKMAAEKLVPVTLELGGKSPCIVEDDANIKVAARRIALSKFSNTGQMCVAPDYVLVHHSKKDELLKELKKAIDKFFGADASESYEYGRIIDQKQFDRLVGYLQGLKPYAGGKTNRQELYMEPTLLDDVKTDDQIMQDEIFGPLLPVIGFTDMEEAKSIIAKNANPLAMYIFTSSAKKEEEWLSQVSFGGGCVNNTALHLTNPHLPFGGRGNSGSGQYHGPYSFETFSHKKSILKTPTWFDPSIKYPPFKGKLKWLKKFIG